MTPAQLLFASADAIDERGHAKGALCRADGSVCAIGALCLAATGEATASAWRNKSALAAHDALRSLVGDIRRGSMKISETLYAAADYIREHGWCRGMYLDPEDGRVCLVGAIALAKRPAVCSNVGTYVIAYLLCKKELSALRRVTDCGLESFNNFECRSPRDAVAALEIAADIACAEGR